MKKSIPGAGTKGLFEDLRTQFLMYNNLIDDVNRDLKIIHDNIESVDNARALADGIRGTINDFLSAKKQVSEHPLAFLHRLKNYLEASNININDQFALQSTVDRLYSNLDQTTQC